MNEEPLDEPVGISKTQRKQEMHALQALGEELAALSEERLATLDLPESLLDAVIEARRLNKHEALRRQMQYIGRLMRDIDAAPIKEKLDAIKGISRSATAHLHRIEHWRDRLLDDPRSLDQLLAEYRDADAQALRSLIRAAILEREAGKPPKHQRQLFRQLREMMERAGDGD